MTAALGPLRHGARVAVLGTAGPPPQDRLDGALTVLRDFGLVPVVYESARATHPRATYLTGPDDLRAADLQRAWCDPTIEGIVCIRGGYGTVRMLDLLDRDLMARAAPKPVYGSSDVTALHEWLREGLGVATWFAPMPGTAAVLDDPAALSHLREAMTTPWRGRRFHGPDARVLVPGTATGTLVGGNLSLLSMTLGARSRPPLDHRGTIVLLEDVGEETYRLDGFLTSLVRAGWFDGVAAVALGSWLDCDPDEARDLCVEVLAPLGVPMVSDLPFGHGPGAWSLPLGVPVTLHAAREGAVALEVEP